MTVLAHAFGARYELPIPLYLFVLGGGLVVILSFLIVSRRAATAVTPEAEVVDGSYLRPLHPVAGTIAVLWFGFLCWCGLAGSQETAENLIDTFFWILVWVGVPLSCALIGDWTQPVNPFAFVAKLADRPGLRKALLGSPDPVRWPDWLAWWPAVVLFFLSVLAELIYNLTWTIPHVIATALAIYAGFSALMGMLFGREWLRRGEMFTVLLDTWGRLGWFRFGAPGRRRFGGGLERPFAPQVSRVVFVLLMLLNVNFDGLLSTPQWASVKRDLPTSWATSASRLHTFDTLAFVAMAIVLAAVILTFAHASAIAGEHRTGPLGSLTGLLPSLLPIAFGYLFAHYLEYILINGQLMLPLIGNPPGLESWPIHLPYPFNDDYEVHPNFLPSAFYWYVALGVIIAVHVAAVVLAHRHLVRIGATERLRLRSEYPWLVAMVGYTCLSLWLLAQPLINETSSTSG